MAAINKVDAVYMAMELIKPFEGCRLKAYKCPAGIWTIGWGETQGVKEGDVWNQEQADAKFEARVKEFMNGVLHVCPTLIGHPRKLAACTSLAYNIGIGAFSRSSICRNVNNGAWTAAANAFLLYDKAGGKVLAGLARRRKAERKMFLGER